MAKQNGTKTTVAIIGLVLTAVVIGSGLVTYAVTNTHETGDVGEKLAMMKEDGCDKAIETDKKVAVLESQLQGLVEDISFVQIQQTALSEKQDRNTAEIIKAIEDITP